VKGLFQATLQRLKISIVTGEKEGLSLFEVVLLIIIKIK
jgi:hypothetical protein